ncbi:MAG: hypothetical protein J6T03_00595 [Bacteroidales bacterium]|nr:hypothetical protein [Bacteroidales bacterium]
MKAHTIEQLPDSKLICKSYTELMESQGNLIVKMKTDWTLGKNEKTTLIEYENGGNILLNHSAQTVTLIKDNKKRLLFDNGDKPRLLTQYINMLKDCALVLGTLQSNYNESLQIHKLLLNCPIN